MSQKFYYIVECFDLTKWKTYRPDPCLFETEKEADKFCEQIEDANYKEIYCSYKKSRLGKMNLK
jgi:hypothetical protein